MKIGWGTKIAILYIGFVVMILTLVGATFFTKTELVADDYYHQETIFQKRINALNASAALRDSLTLTVNETTVDLHFPQSNQNQPIKASIHFYAPSSATADRLYEKTTVDQTIHFDRSKLRPIPYEMQVNWQMNGKDYYQAIALNLHR